MKILIDTHVFIWIDANASFLSERAIELLKSPENTVFLSTASLWDISIKVGNMKLDLRDDLQKIVADQVQGNRLQILNIETKHVYQLSRLPSIHKDPFDRMLIAQATAENAVLMTSDSEIRKYPIPTEW